MSWEVARAERAQHLRLQINAQQCADGALVQLAEMLSAHRGNGRCTVGIDYRGAQARVELVFGERWRVQPSEELLKSLRGLLGAGQVALHYERRLTAWGAVS